MGAPALRKAPQQLIRGGRRRRSRDGPVEVVDRVNHPLQLSIWLVVIVQLHHFDSLRGKQSQRLHSFCVLLRRGRSRGRLGRGRGRLGRGNGVSVALGILSGPLAGPGQGRGDAVF
jgi:hypothetical protein